MSVIVEKLKITGRVEIRNQHGVLVRQANLIVTTGLDWMALMLSGVGTAMSHIATGTSATAAALGDTILGNELARKAVITNGGVVTDSDIEFEVNLLAGESTGALTEIGLFNAASSGIMAARTVFPVYNKGVNDILNIKWIISLA